MPYAYIHSLPKLDSNFPDSDLTPDHHSAWVIRPRDSFLSSVGEVSLKTHIFYYAETNTIFTVRDHQLIYNNIYCNMLFVTQGTCHPHCLMKDKDVQNVNYCKHSKRHSAAGPKGLFMSCFTTFVLSVYVSIDLKEFC